MSALTCSLVGPLGSAGGAIAGFLGSISVEIISHATNRAERNAKNQGIAKDHRLIGTALVIAAIVGSFFAAAAITGVSISFSSIVVTALVFGLVAIPVSFIFNFLKDACFPIDSTVRSL